MGKDGRYELLLVDADDTLFDFGDCEDRALAETFAGAGLRLDGAAAAAYREINASAWKRVELGQATQARIKYERFELLALRLGLEADPRALAEAYIDSLSRQRSLVDGALDVVRYLAGRYRLVMLTNGISQVQRGRIEPSPLRPHFAGLVISEEVGAAKPDPRIFETAAGLGGVSDKSAMLMIGDSLSSDIDGAAAYGIDSCWFNPGGADRRGRAPTYEIRALSELREIL